MNESEYFINDNVVISDEIKHMSKEEIDKEIDDLEKSLGLTKKAASAF